jgi:hypothetical protein
VVRLVVGAPTDDEAGVPRTRVAVDVIRAGVETSLFAADLASCSRVPEPSEGSLVTVRCWWAGSGDEIQIRSEAGAITVTRRQEDEEETAPAAPTEVGRLAIPEGTAIVLDDRASQ